MVISAGLIQSWSLRNPRLPSPRLREACHVISVITITLGSIFSNCSWVFRPCHRSVKPLKPCERACCNQGVPGSLIFTIGSHSSRSNAKTKHFHRSWMIINLQPLCGTVQLNLPNMRLHSYSLLQCERALRVRLGKAKVTTFRNWFFAVCRFRFHSVWTGP